MRINNKDSGVDVILEILKQSQVIKANKQNKKESNALNTKEVKGDNSYNRRASLKRQDTDKDLMLLRKGRHNSNRKRDDDYNKTKGLIEGILNRMTAQDYKKLSDEGFKPEELTIEALTSALQLVKDNESGNRNRVQKENTLNKKNDTIKGTYTISEDEIIKRMEDENLPINDESIERVKSALKLSEGIPHMGKKDMLYVLNNQVTPSIENLYKARYSNQSNENIVKLSDSEWEDLIPQVKEIIEGTELELDSELIEDARWLIENNIPLTNDNIDQLRGLKDLTKNYNKDAILDRILEGMKEGDLPEDVALIEQQAKALTAKRQLEETRLKMTLEAAMRLENKDFNLETEALERVVERLRSQEEIYYKELYNQSIADSRESSLRLLQITSESMEALKAIPIHVLGMTLRGRENQTVPDLLSAGSGIIAELDRAKEAYEALFTIPNTEYGDSIKKAFANAGSLMEEMGIDNTEYNHRAIRILGYNKMDITKESIEQVKAYDLSVSYLIQNLNPGVAVQIIKDGVNPMDTPIDELNRHIESLAEQGYSSLDKYSSYLYKLEKEEGISEAERKAYIGIYRLLYQIEKSDGAALGAVIKSDREVTLNHLLTALRTNKKGDMNYKVDDDFGTLQERSFSKESISDQIASVFHDGNYSIQSSVQNEIQKAIVKDLLNSLTPHKLQELHNSILSMAAKTEGASTQPMNVWETIGNMPTEQLLQQIKNIQTNPGENQAYYYERVRELQEIYSKSDQSIRFLSDFNIPCTTNNLMMAGQILNNSGTVFKKLFGLMKEEETEEDEKSQSRLKKKLDLSDTLIDNETMTEVYEQLEQEVKAIIEEESSEEQIDAISLTQLKSMGMQMQFMRNLAKREFYQIPIEASGKITNVNLTIIRGKSSEGKVTVSLISEGLGSIKAEASLKDNKLNGYISSDHKGSLKTIEAQAEQLEAVAQEENITIKQLNFSLQQASDSIYSYQSRGEAEGNKNPETERILYRIAKTMIHMVRSAEYADNEVA